MARRLNSLGARVRLSPRARRNIVVSLLAAVAFGLAVLMAAWNRACAGNSCPSIAELGQFDPNQASKVYAADGRLITDLGQERRTVVPLGEMSPVVKSAFITTEDKRFYEHEGIDWYRVLGAIKNNLFEMRVAEGFSTITMQLARNVWTEDISGRDKSLRRKLREARVAREIEEKYPKDKILELYLNQIDLGNRAFGVEAASQRYFGKSVRDLNVAEAATLAAIPKAPSRYNPRKNPNLSVQRRNTVLNLLRDNGLLAPEETERWKAYPLLLSSTSDYSGTAEYFVEFVRQQLDARFGSDLYRSGYRIYTTLDLDTQQAAERALEARLEAIESGADGKFEHPTYQQYQNSKADESDERDRTTTPYLQGLVVTIEAKTGQIRAMIGGRDFGDSKFNRATQALRQPGSTFKPITFSAAIEAGYPLSHVMVDDSLSLLIKPDEPPWTPQNYDLEFDGPMTLRRALYLSRNIIAIKLGMELGEQAVVSEAAKFGISTRVPAVPSIHIGSADVIPLEMIAAYTTFANLGVRTVPNSILRVEDRSGKIIWQPAGAQRRGARQRARLAYDRRPPGRGSPRHRRGLGRRPDQLPGRRQDRHHQRRVRRLVHRVHPRSRHRGVDRLRPAQKDQVERAGRRARGSRVDRDDARDLRAAGPSGRDGRGPPGSPRWTSTRPPATRRRPSAPRTSTTSSPSSPAPSRPASAPSTRPSGTSAG